MKKASVLLAIGFFLIVTILTMIMNRICAQSVFIPEMPIMSVQKFTIPVQYNVPGIRKIEWKQTIGNATIVNPSEKYPQITGAVDGDYRFDVFVTDSLNRIFTDWVPVKVVGAGSIVESTVIRDTVYIPRDTCSINYSKINDISFVIMLPDVGGTAVLPDSTTIYKAINGAAQPHVRLKDDLSIRVYRFTRTYTINGVSQSVRFTLYKTGAWIREIKNSSGVWTILDY